MRTCLSSGRTSAREQGINCCGEAYRRVSRPKQVNPHQLAGGDHVIFLSGNDTTAKAHIEGWLRDWFGWEQIWVRLYGVFGTPLFGFKIVRE